MKIFKNSIFTFILGALIFSSITALGTSLIYSKDVSYDNTSSGLSSTTVQGALNELYEKAKNAPSCNSNGECTVSCPSGKSFEATSNGYKCIPIVEATIKKMNQTIVTSGDGLYKDSVIDGRYYYRGSNVNNYIEFNNEIWRIISLESDGTFKIVKNSQLSGTYAWDAAGNRNSTTSTYCPKASSHGCNAWVATSNLVGSPSNFTQYYPNGNTSDSTNYTGTVTQDSTMATYLNGTYYNSLSTTAKTKVVKGTFNVSTPGFMYETESLEIDAEQEKQYQWKGYVALYTVTELLRASTNSSCTSLNAGYNNYRSSPCNQNNWLWPTFNTYGYEWTLSPSVGQYSFDAFGVLESGMYVTDSVVFNSRGIRPVLHLSSDIKLSGIGSSTDPYKIVS